MDCFASGGACAPFPSTAAPPTNRFLNYFLLLPSPPLPQILILFVLYFGMNAVLKEKTVELFAFIIAAVLQLLRTAYEYAFCFSVAATPSHSLHGAQIRDIRQQQGSEQPHARRHRRQLHLCQRIHTPRLLRQENIRLALFQVPHSIISILAFSCVVNVHQGCGRRHADEIAVRLL